MIINGCVNEKSQRFSVPIQLFIAVHIMLMHLSSTTPLAGMSDHSYDSGYYNVLVRSLADYYTIYIPLSGLTSDG